MVTELERRAESETLRDDVRVGDIFLDETYGRAPHEAHVNELAASWDGDKAGVVYVSLRPDGRFACIDGWHRICAYKRIAGPDATVAARVYIDLTVEQESALFYAFNRKRVALDSIENFHALLVAGDPKAKRINEIVESVGLRISATRHRGPVAGLRCVSALERSFDRLGEHEFTELLTLMARGFDGDSSAFVHASVAGATDFWLRYHDVANRSRLIDVLRRTGNDALIAQSHRIRAIMPTLSLGSSYGRAIAEAYNKNVRREYRLPEWQERAFQISPVAKHKRSEKARQANITRYARRNK